MYAYYSWDGTVSRIRQLDSKFGAEFEFNLYNTNTAYSGIRPFCTLYDQPYPSYKDNFWAKNYGWSWQAFSNTASTAAVQPYADLNDLSDSCTRQSIALGLRYPQQLAPASTSFADFTFVITAPRGTVASNRLGSVIQSTENRSCIGSSGALTDCMGLDGGVARTAGDLTGAYTMLNWSIRNRYAPGTCWSNTDTNNNGLTDEDPYYFSCGAFGG